MITRFAPANSVARKALGWVLAAGALLLFTQVILPGDNRAGRGTPMAIMFQGGVVGVLNGMTAAGLILIYRANRIINFAQGLIGLIAYIFVLNMVGYNPGFPFPLTMLMGLALSTAVGVLLELVFGRRFAKAPRLVFTVMTIVGSLVLFTIATTFVIRTPFFPPLDERNPARDLSPERIRSLLPFSGWDFHIGSLNIAFGFAEILALWIAALAFLGLALFFRLSKSGVAVRAASQNAERAALLGIGVGGLSTLVWGLAGLLSGANAIADGLLGDPAGFSRGNVALLAPIAAAVLAQMRSVPIAVGVSVAIGAITEATNYSWANSQATVAIGLFVAVVASLLIQRRASFRESSATEEASWQSTAEPRPVPKEMQDITAVRLGRIVVAAVVVLAAVGLPFLVATRIQNLFSVVCLTGIVGLSLVVLTGWAGQISLGQFGFVAVSAAISGSLAANANWTFWLAVPAATIATAIVAGIVGLPALRIRGLYLAVATFAFAVAVSEIFQSTRMLRNHLPSQVDRPSLFFLDFEDERSMYFLCLAALIIAVVVIVNLRRSRFGRLLIASRENENDVQSFGVSLVRLKLLAFVTSGALAGFAGAIYAFQQRSVDALNFGIDRSFQLFAYTVMGGVSAASGALLGLAYGNIAGYFFQNNIVWGLVINLIPVVVLFIAPGGLISILNQVRDSWLRIIAQRRQLVVPSLFADYDPELLARQLIPLSEAGSSQGLAALPVGQRFALESDLYAPADGDEQPARETREIAAITAASESQ